MGIRTRIGEATDPAPIRHPICRNGPHVTASRTNAVVSRARRPAVRALVRYGVGEVRRARAPAADGPPLAGGLCRLAAGHVGVPTAQAGDAAARAARPPGPG